MLRQVALDVIPSELLQAIEVSKSLTPDMDGDAIGGTVNLVMKQAPEHLRLLGRARSGYNALQDSYAQNTFSATAGRRLAGGRVGAIVSAAGSETNRANDDVEVSYTGDLGLADFDPRYYEVNRRRIGATAAVDVRGPGTSTYTMSSPRIRPSAALARWKAAIDAKVDFLATDQYEAFARVRAAQLGTQ